MATFTNEEYADILLVYDYCNGDARAAVEYQKPVHPQPIRKLDYSDMRIFTGWCHSKARLDGKTAVVTGCNTGIGYYTVLDFVKRGARVVMACRDIVKTRKAADDIRKETANLQGIGEMVIVKLDLSSLKSIEQCALHILQTEEFIHLLINNAGVLGNPKEKTEDGFEMHIGVNHLGHFFFTCLLLPRILRSAPARIVNVSSISHWVGSLNFDQLKFDNPYHPFFAYARSKLANVLFTKELARRLQGTGVTTYSLHPGIVRTDLYRHEESFSTCLTVFWNAVLKLVSKNSEEGAQTTIYCAVDEDLENESGYYYSDCAREFESCKSRDEDLARRLWDESASLVGIQHWNPFTAPDTNYVQPRAV